jgi:transaldolase/glucose-6-phosphate isomerase
MNRLQQLGAAGQGVWLDFVDRKFLGDGGLDKLVAEDGLTGVTSNPSIFEKAMGHSDAYAPSIERLSRGHDLTPIALYEALAVEDIQKAADALRVVYDRTGGVDGYVSLEVSPRLAHQTAATIAEAHRLHDMVARANLMIKVPGTAEGVPAIRQLIADGLSINVTLLFAIPAYQAVAMAYVEGLEARVAKGLPVDGIASVASFFLSRIDAVVDKRIDALQAAKDPRAEQAAVLKGRIAIASAKNAYAWYQELVASARWQALAAKGAKPQRLLWASTGTKNPDYSDVLYVDELIGPQTVNTLPPKTLDAFRDHGTVARTLTQGTDQARADLAEAEVLGLDLAQVTADLVTDGVKQFADAFEALLGAVDVKRAALQAASH